jgi:hypothetical protein
MGRDFATQFLNRKRKGNEDAQKLDITISLAPSPYERYGLNTGMGEMPLQSGKYTGDGPNGVSEPHMPTERRVSMNGRPYVVDESEVLVNDAETVRAYGGPEALDRFIQQNRPDGQVNPRMSAGNGAMPQIPEMNGAQMRCGGSPDMRCMAGGVPNAQHMYPTGAIVRPQGEPPLSPGLERPYDRQFNILREVKYGQVPRMGGGGPIDLTGRTITTEDPATQATINPQTGGVEYTGELKNVSGPTAAPIPQMNLPTFSFPQSDIGQAQPIPQMNLPTFQTGIGQAQPLPQTNYPTFNVPVMPTIDAAGNLPGESEALGLGSSPYYGAGDYANQPGTMSGAIYDAKTAYGITSVTDLNQITKAFEQFKAMGKPIPKDLLQYYTAAGGSQYDLVNKYGYSPTNQIWLQQVKEGPAQAQPGPATPGGAPVPPEPIIPPQPGMDPSARTGTPTLSPAMRDQMILDQYLTRQAGMQASERAGEAQRLMQQGVGDEAQRGMLAVSDVSRRSALGETAAKFGIDAATRAEQRAVQQQEFAEGKRRWDAQFGVQEANQRVTDAGSMTKDTWLAKYPDMKPEDYDRASRMSDVVYDTNAHTLTEMRNSYTGKQVYDYYQSHLDSSWRTDAGAKQAMVVHYNELGGEAALGPFDAWADAQEGALRDPRVNTLIGQYRYELDSMVEEGIMTKEDADDMFDFFTDFASGKLQMKRIWTVGEEEFDSEQAAVDHANANGVPLTSVKSRWTAIDQTTGKVYDPDDPDANATVISATSYGVLNGLSYGTGELTGNLANGETFSTDGAMKIGAFGYNIPKGTYTVETDGDGSVWYKAEDGKYYLASVKDSAGVNIIKANTDLMSKISAGMNEPSLGDVDLKPEKVEFSPTDMKIGQTFDAKEGSLFGPPEGYVGPLQINNVQPHGPYPEYNEYGITDLGSGKTYSILPMVRASDGKFFWYYKGWTTW